jgi:hypothetical protein
VVALRIGMHLPPDMQFANILAMRGNGCGICGIGCGMCGNGCGMRGIGCAICINRGEKGNHVGLPLPMRIHNMPQNDKKSTQPLTNAQKISIFLY